MTNTQNALFHVEWRIDASGDSPEDVATDQVAQYFDVDCPVDQLLFSVKEQGTDAVVTVDAYQALIDGNAPAGPEQKDYLVTFTQSVNAPSAEQAARMVYQSFFTQDHQANAFHVRKEGDTAEVLIDFSAQGITE